MNEDPKEPKFVIVKPGEVPDIAKGQGFLQVCPELLRRWDTEQDLQLYKLEGDTSVEMTYRQKNFLSCTYAMTLLQATPEKIQVRDEAGNKRPLVDPSVLAADNATSLAAVTKALDDLKTSKDSGIYSEDDNVWLLPPASQSTDFEGNLMEFKQKLPEVWAAREQMSAMLDAEKNAQFQQKKQEPYPTEVSDADEEMFPGLNGNKVLESTLSFITNCPPPVRFLVGALAGIVAYQTMGLKGVIGMYMLIMMLKRVLKMGAKVIEDQRVDMVTRATTDGIPVDKNGKIDPAFLEALYRYPVGDHELRSREVKTKLVREMDWPKNAIAIDPNIKITPSEDIIAQHTDGDTLTGESNIRYRLAGIDAAELDHEHGVHQPGAQLAWERIQELVPAGTKIRVETIGNQPMRGNRQPVYMYYTDAEGKEVCLNEVLLDEGLCRPTNIEPYHPKIKSFINKFVEAAYNRHGLWNEKFNPVKAPSLISLSKTVEPTPDGGQKTEFAIN